MNINSQIIIAAMQRLTGRRYRINLDGVDEETKREIGRFIRDVTSRVSSIKRSARNLSLSLRFN